MGFSKVHFSFLLDWIFIIVLIGLYLPLNKISPFEREFSLDDETISHPHKEDTFSILGLAIFAIVFPVVLMTLYHVIKRDLSFSFHQTILGYCTSIALALFVTTLIKVSVGRYRPDFISRCQVDFAKVEKIYDSYAISKGINYGPRNLFNTSICTNTDRAYIDEGRKSFPSGHTSFAFSSLTYTSLFIAGKLHIYDGNYVFWKLLAAIIPNIFALYIALTRISDYRHHWQDVFVGGLIGIIFSLISYFYYFPFLNSQEPYRPLDGRLRNYNIYEDPTGKTLPMYRDRDSEVIDVNVNL